MIRKRSDSTLTEYSETNVAGLTAQVEQYKRTIATLKAESDQFLAVLLHKNTVHEICFLNWLVTESGNAFNEFEWSEGQQREITGRECPTERKNPTKQKINQAKWKIAETKQRTWG